MTGTVIELQNKLATPGGIILSASQRLRIEAAFATFDGTGAASAFEPCLTFLAPDGKVLSRVRPSATIAAGASADVSYAPFPGGIGGAGADTDDVLFNSVNHATDPRYLYADANQHGQASGIAGLNSPGVFLKSLESYGILLWTTDANGRIVLYSPGANGGIRLVSGNGFRFYEDVFTNEILSLTSAGSTNLLVLNNNNGVSLLVVSGAAGQSSITFYDTGGNQLMHMDSTDKNLHIKAGKAVIADL